MRDEELFNRFGNERISHRQIDELIGLARGLCADGVLNQMELEFLQKWLASNVGISDQPVVSTLYSRVNEILLDGLVDRDESAELLATLTTFSAGDYELGEALKATTLPICQPAPRLEFASQYYCFTGTFNFGGRRQCEEEVKSRGGECSSLTRRTNVLVIGVYATESWKHSTFGHKVMKACEMRDQGVPISIVTEEHWASFL